jgi:hypothetical protein
MTDSWYRAARGTVVRRYGTPVEKAEPFIKGSAGGLLNVGNR